MILEVETISLFQIRFPNFFPVDRFQNFAGFCKPPAATIPPYSQNSSKHSKYTSVGSPVDPTESTWLGLYEVYKSI